jgi:hypothetical protein
VRGKLGLEGQFRTLPQSVKELLDEFLSSGGLAVCETAVGVVYGHGEMGLHTNSIRTLGST